MTAVREQPAEPDDVHYYFTELRTGLTYCGVVVEDDLVETTSESGKATCIGCLAAAGEDPPGARDADGFLRLKGTATGDNQLDPEPEPQRTAAEIWARMTSGQRAELAEGDMLTAALAEALDREAGL